MGYFDMKDLQKTEKKHDTKLMVNHQMKDHVVPPVSHFSNWAKTT